MNTLEDQLREALDSKASGHDVHLDALWRDTEPRLRKKPRAPMIAIAAASVGVAATLGVGALTAKPPATAPADIPSPHSTTSLAAALRDMYAIEAGELDWRTSKRLVPLGEGQNLLLSKALGYHDGSRWVGVSYRIEPNTPLNPGKQLLVCSQYFWLAGPTTLEGGSGCADGKRPEPEDADADLLTVARTHQVTADATDKDWKFGFEFATGKVAKNVARVVGVDADGDRHDGVFSGWSKDWERRQYLLASSVKLARVEAYDAAGSLVATVPVPK